MDEGAKDAYEGLTPADKKDKKRKVMGGGTGGKLGGNLFSWTIRHELGHGVDAQIDWTAKRAHLPGFGHWKQHGSFGDKEVAGALLTNAGINYATMPFRSSANPRSNQTDTLLNVVVGNSFLGRNMQTDVDTYAPALVTSAKEHDPQFDAKWTRFLEIVHIGQAQPWTLADGGGPPLEQGDRRFHMDHYDTWVSYSKSERSRDSLSRYMFSSPGEWFAEAYAAYYAGDAATRNQLRGQVREFFAKQLGGPRSAKALDLGEKPALAEGGVLKELGPVDGPIQEILQEII
jgi:hypothetical protein